MRIASTVAIPTVPTSFAPCAATVGAVGIVGADRSHATRLPCLEEIDFGDVLSGEDGAFRLLGLGFGGNRSCWRGIGSCTSGSGRPDDFINSM